MHFCLHFLLNPLLRRASWRVIVAPREIVDGRQPLAVVLKLRHLSRWPFLSTTFQMIIFFGDLPKCKKKTQKLLTLEKTQEENSPSLRPWLSCRPDTRCVAFETLDTHNSHDFTKPASAATFIIIIFFIFDRLDDRLARQLLQSKEVEAIRRVKDVCRPRPLEAEDDAKQLNLIRANQRFLTCVMQMEKDCERTTAGCGGAWSHNLIYVLSFTAANHKD